MIGVLRSHRVRWRADIGENTAALAGLFELGQRMAFGPIHDAAKAGDSTKVEALLAGDPMLIRSEDAEGPHHCLGRQALIQVLFAASAPRRYDGGAWTTAWQVRRRIESTGGLSIV